MNYCNILDCRQLRIFLAAWEYKNLSRAATDLHLSQPTVSAHLKTLEEQLSGNNVTEFLSYSCQR